MRRLFLPFFLCGIALLLMATTAFAKEPESPEITFQQAVEKALANSEQLKNADFDVTRGDEVREFLADKVDYIPNGQTHDAESKAFTSLVQADLNYQLAKKNYAAQKDIVIMQTYQAYNGLLSSIEKVKVAEAQVKNAQQKNIVAMANYRVGLINQSDLLQATTAYESAKESLEASRKALDDAYQRFNQLVGLWPEDRPVLVDKPSFKVLSVDNLETEVERRVDESPTVYAAKQKIDLNNLNLNLYDFTSSTRTEPYKAKQIDVDKAEVSLTDEKEKIRKTVRTIYYNIKQLEDQYAIAQENIKTAEETLRVTRVKYEVGMAIQADVVAAEAALAQAKQALVDIVCQHDTLCYAFYKPWAYSGSSSTSTGSSGSGTSGSSK